MITRGLRLQQVRLCILTVTAYGGRFDGLSSEFLRAIEVT